MTLNNINREIEKHDAGIKQISKSRCAVLLEELATYIHNLLKNPGDSCIDASNYLWANFLQNDIIEIEANPAVRAERLKNEAEARLKEELEREKNAEKEDKEFSKMVNSWYKL